MPRSTTPCPRPAAFGLHACGVGGASTAARSAPTSWRARGVRVHLSRQGGHQIGRAGSTDLARPVARAWLPHKPRNPLLRRYRTRLPTPPAAIKPGWRSITGSTAIGTGREIRCVATNARNVRPPTFLAGMSDTHVPSQRTPHHEHRNDPVPVRERPGRVQTLPGPQPKPQPWAEFVAESTWISTRRGTTTTTSSSTSAIPRRAVETTFDLDPDLVTRFVASRPPDQSKFTLRGYLCVLQEHLRTRRPAAQAGRVALRLVRPVCRIVAPWEAARKTAPHQGRDRPVVGGDPG